VSLRGGNARGAKAREASSVGPLNDQRGAHVLVAEDDEEMRRILVESLTEEGYSVTAVPDGTQLRRRLVRWQDSPRMPPADIVVSDIRLPGFTGLQLLEELRQADWSLPVVLITAFGDETVHTEGNRLGAARVLDKPFDIDELVATLKELVSP
jgi:DNA-binding response OmpR family regulator